MTEVSADDRWAIMDLYADYSACLSSGNLERWADFFTEDCRYVVQPRENFDAGLPLALMRLESKGMLQDRIFGVRNTLYFAPYYQRIIVGVPRLHFDAPDQCKSEANFMVVRTKDAAPSDVFVAGRYLDELHKQEGQWRWRRRLCVLDTELIPNSMIYPV